MHLLRDCPSSAQQNLEFYSAQSILFYEASCISLTSIEQEGVYSSVPGRCTRCYFQRETEENSGTYRMQFYEIVSISSLENSKTDLLL